MKIIGLTGGIGSGKSTAARFLEEEGIPVIDADQAGHLLLAENGQIQEQVIAAFGEDVLVEGRLSREKLAAYVFSDESARTILNALLHPAIIESVMQRCAALCQQGCPVIVVEAALLSEGGRKEPWLDGLILVLTDADKRIDRLVTYRNMEEQDARQRLVVQTAPETKRPLADWIIHNGGDLENLREQVNSLAEELRSLET
jgi:dephospho-CoA kinase